MSHSSNTERRNKKRDQFSRKSARSGLRPNHVIGVAGAAFVILLIILAVGMSTKSSAATVVTATADGVVQIPLANLSDGRVRFYEYRASNNMAVRFFVIKSSDGVYRAAADACKVCYRDKLGYHQEGDDLVCNKCGRRFRSKNVNVITGSCNPDGIPRTIQGNNLLIAAADLDARAFLF
jgi:uncharacterized membrane protein